MTWQSKSTKIELLAPAKDKACAMAAIDFGADAVYMGASEFGARKKVPNSLEDIKEVVEYAHRFNAKVYITLNTILTDKEIFRAKTLVEKLTEIGVDAIIVQDMGLLEALSEKPFEMAPLHASTQCDIRTPEKAKFLECVGFSRLILARELSLKEIKEIKKNTNIELEFFIHGSLCVSYSGQCYLSQLIGGRSANRGECAQPCRKKYSLEDEEGNCLALDKYLLCLKDFNASEHLESLIDAGVTSFKIEGRLKDENYVKNVVSFYRKKLDELKVKKSSSGNIDFDFEPSLEKTFNRGFTDYFLKGKDKKHKKDIYSFSTPKAINEYIGKVNKIGADYFELASRDIQIPKLSAQDGLCFFVNEELKGCLVNAVEGNKIYPNSMVGIKVGTEIYRNYNAEHEKTLKHSKVRRKISVKFEFELNKITAKDEDGNLVQIQYEFDELAKDGKKMIETISNQLKKSGESDFFVKEVKVLTKKIPFLPLSVINELRRKLLEALMRERIKNYNLKRIKGLPSDFCNCPHNEIDYKGNILNSYAKDFYKKHGCKVTEDALESGDVSKQGKVAMTSKHCLKNAFGLCGSDKKLFLIDEMKKRYELKFDCARCEMEIVF